MLMRKIIITGAAGLVGQNLVARLKSRSDLKLVGIDKHKANIRVFRQTHPNVPILEADLAQPGLWIDRFSDVDAVVINQAQIGGTRYQDFEANNVTATRNILAAMRAYSVPYFIGVSSSVVNSKADDFYTRSKKAQEGLYAASALPHVILRPTLMFGWFDRKHLGWLRHFMDRTPVFPIPGNGEFIRQPLYVGDFVSVITAAIEHRKTGTFDISGFEKIFYRDLIVMLHRLVKPRARIIKIPYPLFWALLGLYEMIDRNPPFTTSQLEALVIPETFPVIDWPTEFGVRATPLERALTETYLDPAYSSITLGF